MKTDREQQGPNNGKKYRRVGFFCLLSLVIISLVSGYYFFALSLKEINFDRQTLQQRVSILESEQKEDSSQIKNLFTSYEILNRKQNSKEENLHLMNLAQLAEASLIVRDFPACFAVLNLLKQAVDKGNLTLAKEILNRDIERVKIYQKDPYFKVNDRLQTLAIELEKMPTPLVEHPMAQPKVPVVTPKKQHFWQQILLVLKQLVVVEQVKTTVVMPSERVIWLLQARLLINDVNIAWHTDDYEQYQKKLENLRNYLLQTGEITSLWGQTFLAEIDQLRKLNKPKRPHLEIKQILEQQEV